MTRDKEPLTREMVSTAIQHITEEMSRIIVGQEWLIQRLLIGLFSEIPYSFKRGEDERTGYGHVLVEGVPGLAKTLTVMTVSCHLVLIGEPYPFLPHRGS